MFQKILKQQSWIIITLLLNVVSGFYLISYPIHAQSLGSGQALYQKGDLMGAERALKKAINTTNNSKEKSKIFVMLGIVYYTRGDKNLASSQFKNALSLDSQAAINPKDALDPSVFSLFQKVKSELNSESQLASSASKSAPASSKPLAPSAKAPKKTLLKVISKTQEAQVSIDGILAGSVNELINTDAGKVLIEVSAPGHIPTKAYVQIIENQENVISLSLEKIRPKPKPAPAPEIESQGVVAPLPAQASRPKKVSRPKKPRGQADNLFESAERPASRSSGPQKGGGRDLAREFEMDVAQGSQPQYPMPYPAPQQPYPPQGYYPTQPPVYTAPVPYVAPTYPPDPVYRGQEQAYGYRESPSSVRVTSFLPFGIGQLAQRRYVLGVLFMAVESGLGYMYYATGKENTAFATSANAYLKEFCSPGPDETLDENAAIECSTYQTESQNFLKEKKTEQQMYLLGTVGVGLVGVIEAILWDTSDHTPEKPMQPQPKRKRIKPKKYRGFSLHMDPSSIWLLQRSTSENKEKFALDLQSSSLLQLSSPLTLMWEWTF